MGRRAEFDGGHNGSRNHANVTYGEMVDPHKARKGTKNEAQHRHDLQWTLGKKSAEGGQYFGDVFQGRTVGESMISWGEHQRRRKLEELEENG